MAVCPKCGSSDVVYDALTKEYVCYSCGYVWKAGELTEMEKYERKKKERESALDIILSRWRGKEPEETFSYEELLMLLEHYADKDDWEDAMDVARAIKHVYDEPMFEELISDIRYAIWRLYESIHEERSKIEERWATEE